MNGKEIELKLAVSPEALDSLERGPAVGRHRQGEVATKRLRSVYYDTPGQDLATAGVTVRLRVSGESWVQTVKTAGNRASGLFSREEWEVPVAGEALDADQLRATGLPLLQDGEVVARLAPLFATDVRRRIIPLGGEDWRAELALDTGEIQAGEARAALSEVELELREGTPGHLFALAHDVADEVPARLLALSKSDRGYALAAGRAAGPVRSKPVALHGDMALGEAFRAIARNCLHHLLANEPSLVAQSDPEAIHQMRVALRRLRSALKVFAPLVKGPELARMRAEIKWLLAILGPARDTDVFVSEMIMPVVERHAGDAGLVALRDHWTRRRDHDLAAAVAAVRDRRFTALLLDLGAWVEAGDWCTDPDLPGHALQGEKLAPFARALLDRQARRMRKAAGKTLAELAPDHLHEVRILAKQLRYAGEFFASLHGKAAARRYLGALSELQDVLGQINDIAVAGSRLAGGSPPDEHEKAATMVAAWHEARRPKLMDAAEKAWKTLRKRKRFWRS